LSHLEHVYAKAKGKFFLKLIAYLMISIIIGYAFIVALLIFGPRAKNYFQQTDFDPVVWKQNLGVGKPLKQKMISDLFKKFRLVGMSRAQMIELLGTPPKTNYFRNYDFVYWLGPENGMGVDSEWLCIKFENDVVVSAVILTD